MHKVKKAVQKIPGVQWLYQGLRCGYLRYKLKNKSVENIFTDIYHGNRFGGKDSASGPGSDLIQTKVIIKELPILFGKFSISTILDIPCGDFHWMNSVDLDGIKYLGADIVNDLIQNNRKKYKRKNLAFQHLNIIHDSLSKVDLILCRDCLVHLSFKDIFIALTNICNSDSEYLLTTTFPFRKKNHNVLITGDWRTLNLELPPFNFPPPLKLINEACPEGNDAYNDKSLGLWRIEEIRPFIRKGLPLTIQ